MMDWQQLQHLQHTLGWLMERLDRRPLRERQLMLGGLLALTLWCACANGLEPACAHWAAARLGAQQVQAEQAALQQQRAEAQAQARAAAQSLTAELDAWRQRVHQSEALLAQRGGQLMPAREMVGMLDALLRQHRELTLLSLNKLPENTISEALPGTLYRHGVELQVQGSYADLLAYCRALEALPQHLLWGDMSLAADDYPRVRLTLNVYTLSQDKSWLKL
ncbi:MAG TPA: hypothetical protein VGM81_06305 [Burkholderiaceae bacterium]|jgi:MSHA biogenesis protein MshJ